MRHPPLTWITSTDAGLSRLDDYLAKTLTEKLGASLGRPVSKSEVRRWILAGSVMLNRRVVKIASKPVLSGVHCTVWVDIDPTSKPTLSLPREHILFQDTWLLILNKPYGIPTQPTVDPLRPSMVSLAKASFSLPYLALHHRLDRDTSGVLLMVTHPQANLGISQAFKNRLVKKSYRALAQGPIHQPQWIVENYLGPLPKTAHEKKTRFGEVSAGGDFARTAFEVVESRGNVSQVIARPETGRTHQIRVHLAEGGHPVLGDPLYAPENVQRSAPRLMLHAETLTFPHPIHQNEMTVTAPLPTDFNTCWHTCSETDGKNFSKKVR